MASPDASARGTGRLPKYAAESRVPRRLAAEAWDHLWPWSAGAPRGHMPWRAVSIGIAVVVTVAWMLAATGRVGGGATLGWWLGWSVTEVLVRMGSKPYVKEGPWWGQRYRPAGWMDMISYVSFKNLLVGVLVYLGLSASGALEWMRTWSAGSRLPW